MAAYNIEQIKDKKKLVKLANYGTAERRNMRPKVLIGAGKEKPFIEGDILDANATLNLIEDTYDKGRIFRSFSKEGKKIDKEIKELLEKTDENYEQLSSAIADNKEDADQKIDQLSSKVDNIESNIPNLRRVVDIQLQSVLDGTKTYLVTKQGDVQEQIQISDGEKGEQGEKGDPFTYEDFTPEQIEGLKVKGDRGISISSLEQTQTAYTSGGVNEFTVTLDDGTVSKWYVRNGQKGDATKIWVNANTVHSGYYDSDNHEIKLLNADGDIMSIIDATAFIKDGMISDAYVEDGYIVIVFNTDAGQTPIMIPVTDIFDADDYYTKQDTDARIAEDVLVETQRAEAAELQLADDLAQEVSDRLSGDTTLNTKIETETTRATTAESGLSTQIRQLGSALYSEQQNRAAADNLLESRIGAETSRATTAEGLLDQRITSNSAAILTETTRATNAEEALSDAIDAEESTRIQEIDDLQDLLDAYIQSNNAAVQDEISRATAAEQTNATAIATESSRAQSAELALLGAINTEASTRAAAITAEETRATTAELALQDNIDAEEQRAIAAELDLQDAIDAVEQGAGQGITEVQQALNDEITRATGAESQLSSDLSAEITRATNADNANATAISNEVARATLSEQQNAADIDAVEALIPSQATSENQLADKAFVNSSIATSTATFVGTFNSITDLYAVTTADVNDYGYVVTTDSVGNTKYNRYKYDGSQWNFEYSLNNSSFTAEEWAAIQSGMTQALRTKLENLPNTAVTSVGVSVPTGLTVTDSPITSSGTIAINFENGYSIPTIDSQTNWDTAYSWGNHANANYVKSVKVGTTAYNPSSGIVSLPAYPTTLPASDVYSWAKASTKPSYTLDEVSDGSTRKLANYLPLSGGMMTGAIIFHGTAGAGSGSYIVYSGANTYIAANDQGSKIFLESTYDTAPYFRNNNGDYTIWHSGNLTNNNQLTNGAGYITGITSSMVTSALGYTPANSSSLSNYLPLSGGTLTDTLHIKSGTRRVQFYNSSQTVAGYLAWTENNYGNYVEIYNPITAKGIWIGDMNTTAPVYYDGGNQRAIWHSGNLTKVSQLTNDSGYITSSGSITGNAASATKLQTARTIWGQSFDGTGDISGDIISRGGTMLGIKNIELNSGGHLSNYGGYIDFHYNGDSADYTSRIIEIERSLLNINNILYVRENGSLNGYVGVGTMHPAYKLDVAGEALISGTTHIANCGIGFNRNVSTGAIFDSSKDGGQIYYSSHYGGFEFGTVDHSTSSYNIKMFLSLDGNLGVGTTSPSGKLHIVSSSSGTTGSGVYIEDAGNFGWMRSFQILCPNIATGVHVPIAVGKSDSLYNQGQVAFYYAGSGSTSNAVTIGLHSKDDILNVVATGNVGIGTLTPSYTLHVAGDAAATNFYTTSDSSKKDNITSLSEHIRKFTLKETGKEHYGVIAQEVEEMFREGEEGSYTVNYNSILSYYIGLLENRVAELENKVKELSHG